MATSPTPRMGLERPLEDHQYSRGEYADNLSKIDQFPGVFICTSGTRPVSWGAAHSGMQIWETDRSLMWRWDGAAFVRVGPLGLLADPSQLTSDESTAATTPTSALARAVTVPPTNAGSTTRRIKVTASWYAITNGSETTYGVAEVSILRGSSVIVARRVRGRPSTDTDYLDWGGGGALVAYDNPAAGAHTYHLAINSIAAVGGTTTLIASPTTPAQLAVEEVGL